MANIKLTDLEADPNTLLTSVDPGDFLLVHDISETIDVRKIKVISEANLLKLVTETARQAVIASQTEGDLFYASSGTALARLAKGADGSILTETSGLPSWLAKGATSQVLKMNSGATAPEWNSSLFGCRVSREISDQTVNDNTETAIIFDTEVFDDDSYANLATKPTRITIPTTGIYLVGASAYLYSPTTGSNSLYVYLNNSTSIAKFSGPAPAFGAGQMNISTLYQFSAGDYIEAKVSQTSGSAQVIKTVAANKSNSMWIIRIK